MTQAAVERQRRQEDRSATGSSFLLFLIITYQFEPELEDDRMLAESNFLRMRLGLAPQ